MFLKSPAAIIIAAGNSSRLGYPKQLLKIKGETLLHRTVRIVVESGLNPVNVVLGYKPDQMKETIRDLLGHKSRIKIIYNKNWELGMGSSISLGIDNLNSSISSTIVGVCDQPFLSVGLLKKIIKTYQENDVDVVSSRYKNSVLGVPALFSKVYFKNLASLQQDKGARDLLNDNNINTLSVSFPNGNIDIDTTKIANKLELNP